jgi:ubiquinol-cytochrome c reductase cytochrome c subunit
VRFLSTRRRHPLAGLVVVLFGLVVAGALFSAFRPAVADESSKSDADLIAEGRQLYVVGCSSCHGLNAEGIITKRGTNYGPPLIGVGAASVDFQVSTGRMPAARPDTQIPDKKPTYEPAEVEALAAYIASLGPGPAIPPPSAYDVSEVTDEQIARGGAFFRTNCTACHNFAGVGGALPEGRYAPSLRGVEPRFIYEAMLTGPQQMPVFSDEVLKPDEKRDIIAYIKTLEEQTAYGGLELGSRGPVTEGLWGWVFGIGLLVLAAVWIANNGVRAGKQQQS